jgi:hypothetical protein
MRTRRRLPARLVTLAVAASALAALALPSSALASRCGDQVLQDWADNGRIDRVYELQCYRDALDSIPADIEDYTNAHEIISRALAQAASSNGEPGDPTDPSTDGTGGGGTGNDDPSQPGREPSGPVLPPEGGPDVTPTVDGSAASSVPIPLLLLAAMSLLLLGAGGLGYLSRRRGDAGDGLLDTPGDDGLDA